MIIFFMSLPGEVSFTDEILTSEEVKALRDEGLIFPCPGCRSYHPVPGKTTADIERVLQTVRDKKLN